MTTISVLAGVVALKLVVWAPFRFVGDDPLGVGARCSAPANGRPKLRSLRFDCRKTNAVRKRPCGARCSASGAEEEEGEEEVEDEEEDEDEEKVEAEVEEEERKRRRRRRNRRRRRRGGRRRGRKDEDEDSRRR